MSILSFLGINNNQTNSSISEYQEKGAFILDVRTSQEYLGGHIIGSINIPLNELANRMTEVTKTKKPVIVCCQSGMRSNQALSLLKRKNIDAINGGGWKNLDLKLK